MLTNNDPENDKGKSIVEELFKTIITTSGIMLTLLGGLTQRNLDPAILLTIRIASIVLVISMIGSLLGLQFIGICQAF